MYELFRSSSPKPKKARKTRSNAGVTRGPRKVTKLARVNGVKYLNASPNFFNPSPRAKPLKKRESPTLKAKGDPMKRGRPAKKSSIKLTACDKASIRGNIKQTNKGKLYYSTKSGGKRYCPELTKMIKSSLKSKPASKPKKARKTRSNAGVTRGPRKVTKLARVNGVKYLNASPNFFNPSPRAKPMKKRASPTLKAKGDPIKRGRKPNPNRGLTACNKASIRGNIKQTNKGKLYYSTKSGGKRYCPELKKVITKKMSPQDKKLYKMLSKSASKSKSKKPSASMSKTLRTTLGMAPVLLPMPSLKVSPLKVNVKDPKTKKLYVGQQGPLKNLKVGNEVIDNKTKKSYKVKMIKRAGKQSKIKSFSKV